MSFRKECEGTVGHGICTAYRSNSMTLLTELEGQLDTVFEKIYRWGAATVTVGMPAPASPEIRLEKIGPMGWPLRASFRTAGETPEVDEMDVALLFAKGEPHDFWLSLQASGRELLRTVRLWKPLLEMAPPPSDCLPIVGLVARRATALWTECRFYGHALGSARAPATLEDKVQKICVLYMWLRELAALTSVLRSTLGMVHQ